MIMPNFLIIGATKAGTTSLCDYLRQHPQIYISPVKEPRFFALESETDLGFRGSNGKQQKWITFTEFENYCSLFEGVSDEVAIGEASTLYLYSSKAPERISHYAPHMKLVVILRDPVERAYSHYLHFTRSCHEPCSDFLSAFQDEENRIRDRWGILWHYKQMGFYHAQLSHYFQFFNRNQFSIHLYDDWNSNPVALLKDLFLFLGVDNAFMPDMSIRRNQSFIPKSKRLQKFLLYPNFIKSFLRQFLPKSLRQEVSVKLYNMNIDSGFKPPLSVEIREKLIEVYREDILKLEELIDRDLSRWLVP